MSTKPTAYECFLHKNVTEQLKDNPFYTAEEMMSFFLYQDCLQQNPQAFDLVGNVSESGWNKETFVEAAKLIIAKFNN